MKASASDPQLQPPEEPNNMKLSKVLVADLQILGAAFFFGIGFIGQRAVSMDGVGPLTCNAFRFALSTIIIIVCMPWIPSFPAEHEAESDDEDNQSDSDLELTVSPPHNNKDSAVRRSRSNSLDILLPNSKKGPQKPESDQFVLQQLFGKKYYTAYFAGAKRTVVFWGIVLGVLNFFASGFQQWGITMTSANKVAFIAGFDIVWVPILAIFLPSFKRNGGPTPSIWVAVAISIAGLYLLSGARFGEFDMGTVSR
jgi:drug/metabolite transporter (DMT)-like permease